MAQLPLHYFRGPSLTFKVAWMNPYGWKLGGVAVLYSALLHSAPVLLLSCTLIPSLNQICFHFLLSFKRPSRRKLKLM